MELPGNKEAETITVGELRKMLKRFTEDTRVYLLVDTSDNNYDGEEDRWVKVLPVGGVFKEVIQDNIGWELSGVDVNALIHVSEE